MRAGLQVKYNEEAADASESQTADLAKSLDKQKEETSTKAFEGQKQVLDDDKKETTAAMEANKTETAAASEAQTVVFAKRCRNRACECRKNIHALLWLHKRPFEHLQSSEQHNL